VSDTLKSITVAPKRVWIENVDFARDSHDPFFEVWLARAIGPISSIDTEKGGKLRQEANQVLTKNDRNYARTKTDKREERHKQEVAKESEGVKGGK